MLRNAISREYQGAIGGPRECSISRAKKPQEPVGRLGRQARPVQLFIPPIEMRCRCPNQGTNDVWALPESRESAGRSLSKTQPACRMCAHYLPG